MYFLMDACQHPAILRVIYFGYLIVQIVCSVIPIGLIIMLLVDFSRAIISGKEDEQIKSTKLVGKRIMYAILVFLVPWIVSVITKVLSSSNLFDVNYAVCLENAINSGGDFSSYDALLDSEEEALNDKYNKPSDPVNPSNPSVPSDPSDPGTPSNPSPSPSGDYNPGNKVKTVGSGSNYEQAASDLIALAVKNLGATDGTKFGAGVGQAWCAWFATWLLKNTSIEGEKTIMGVIEKEKEITDFCGYGGAGCMMPNFVNNSNLKFYISSVHGGKYTPKKGDIIFFRKKWSPPEEAHADHVGIVESYDSSTGTIHTIEGNTTNGGDKSKRVSARKKHDINEYKILGFGSWYE